ncbi:hypothetical protein Cgig2_017378 [Carnegiea gigantea]|uniref:Uncharacterized protein n=1 Tax=Carnegiea gigantea TaxID=171969 RepID=A0A9Q1K5U7_9CARY|nr:hypothetical protein Cgig2_017378 [Carnegiea gigantea]
MTIIEDPDGDDGAWIIDVPAVLLVPAGCQSVKNGPGSDPFVAILCHAIRVSEPPFFSFHGLQVSRTEYPHLQKSNGGPSESRRWILLANLILSFLSPSSSANDGLRRLNHRESGSLVSILIGTSLTEITILPRISSLPGPTFSSTVTIKSSSKGSDATNMSSSFHNGFTVGTGEGLVSRTWFTSWTLTWVTGGRPLSEGIKS